MRDEPLERKLRSALREEGDRLAFTITPAELERRMALRGRSFGNRRLTLLLAAAVAIGALGAGAILGGLSNKPTPSPAADASREPATPASATPSGPPVLPGLDDLMAADPARVLVAQAYGPADVPRDPLSDAAGQVLIPIVTLGDLPGGGDYQVSVACLGGSPLEVALTPAATGDIEGPRFACDGTVREATVRILGAASAYVWYRAATSWRVVIRGDLRQPPLPTTNPVLRPALEGTEELVRRDNATVSAEDPAWRASELQIQQVGIVPARVVYGVQLWCDPGATVRFLFADEIDGVLTPSVETAVACDGLVHDLGFPLPLPSGSPFFVVAAPGSHWSVLVSSATPPVAVAHDVPGWQVVGVAGPTLQFEDTEMSFSDVAGERGGPLMVVIECVGPAQDVAVYVDLEGILGDAFEAHTARCEPDGSRTSFTFDTGSNGYIVRHAAPAGTWTALTLLIPAASPGP